jgi:hypothetical protein
MIAVVALTGCNAVGPKALQSARVDYNEAIAQTWNQQLLLNLVRLKYRDTLIFLEVDSVNTQYSLSYGTSASSSFSPIDNTSRTLNLSGIGAGASGSVTKGRNQGRNRALGVDAGMEYLEKPTISYTPLKGQKFVTQILSPIPLDTIILLSQSGWSVERIMGMCVQRFNQLPNAPSASGPTPDYEPHFRDFAEVIRLLRSLQTNGELFGFLQQAEGSATDEEKYDLVLQFAEGQGDSSEAIRLRELMDLTGNERKFIMSEGVGVGSDGNVIVQMRSMLGVMHFLSNAVRVPLAHKDVGLVTKTAPRQPNPDDPAAEFDWSEVVTPGLMTIRSQDSRPESAFAAVRYRGAWFYIDDSDLATKSTFELLSYLFYLQAGDIKAQSPLLTIPL